MTPALLARAALCLAVAAPAPTYAELYSTSLASQMPLIVFVGVPARDVPGCLVLSVETFRATDGPCVVCLKPEGGQMWRMGVLPKDATAAAIRAVLDPPPVQAPPQTFSPARAFRSGSC